MTNTKYERLAASVIARIRSGELAPGAQVPSVRELAPEWGETTAKNALRLLQAQGFVTSVPGSGTYVADPLPPLEGDVDEVAELRRRVEDLEAWRASVVRGE